MAIAFTQERSAMQTGVVEGADLVCRRADHDQRRLPDVVNDMIPDIGNLFLPASDLPHARPHAFHLELVKLTRGIGVRAEDLLIGKSSHAFL
jgi:hypothetical protein